MTTLEERITQLSPEKRALLEQNLLARTSQMKVKQTIPRRAPAESYPLSFAQERMWFLEQLYPDSALYNEQGLYRLRGPLNLDALKESMQTIVHRHELLRTVYRQMDGKPVQVILPEAKVDLLFTDLTSLSVADRESEIHRLASELSQQPFDLHNGPVYRATLLQVDKDEHVLIHTRHHIATDGWSTGVYWRELNELYNAYCQGRTPSLPELPIQYADFSLWQRGWLAGEVGQQQLSYWRKQLADLTPLNLPIDRPRPTLLSHSGGSFFFTLPAELTESLKGLSRAENVTLYMVLLTAFQILLHRYSGQHDIAVGSPIANRNRSEIEGLIGFFVNTLVLRSNLSGNPTFRTLLHHVRQTCLDAYAHQDLPFEKLVEELQPERNLDRHPVFQVLFVFQNIPSLSISLRDVETERLQLEKQTTKFDLTLVVKPTPHHLICEFKYDSQLYEVSTVERMAGHFETLLMGICAEPDLKSSQLPILTDEEKIQLLFSWNDTEHIYPSVAAVHHLFEEQVSRTPDRTALIFEENTLSYAELNLRANQLAHHLQILGVGPEILVGLCLERSIELIVGMLAILKAGGAFVPLDPAWPPDRLRMVAEDANLVAIVTRQRYEDRLSNKSLLVSMDQLLLTNELRRNQNPDVPVSPTALAYVLYTSGTTGQPKGVMVEHRQLLSYFWAVVDRLELRSDGVYAMLQPLTVDSCQTMIFPALGRGGTLCLISEERSLDAAALVEYFGHQQIDYLKIAPSHLAALLDHTPSVRLLPHRTLIVGGEAAHWDFVERLWALAPTCTIWNHYGPTETTVGVSVQRLAADADPLSPTVSIGRPLANVQFYILDPYQNPVPVGVPGELYIGGSQVAHGYLQRPDLTSERFIPDPFSGASAKRLYRTGDRARYLSDGSVEFLGRFDDQVKIRGYRVELGEIEVALGQHPLVQERVVIYREAGNGGYHLVGYVVAKALGPEAFGPEVLGSELERDLLTFLRTRLPSHMVPSAILVLEQLPRTRHGKLDRQALPVVESSRFNQSLTHTPPQTPLQKIIADVWRERLDLRQVGLHDNFFQLGGHSLLVIQVISELRKQLAIDLPVQLLFQSPTINELAESIELLRTLEQVRLVSVNGIDEEREEIQL